MARNAIESPSLIRLLFFPLCPFAHHSLYSLTRQKQALSSALGSPSLHVTSLWWSSIQHPAAASTYDLSPKSVPNLLNSNFSLERWEWGSIKPVIFPRHKPGPPPASVMSIAIHTIVKLEMWLPPCSHPFLACPADQLLRLLEPSITFSWIQFHRFYFSKGGLKWGLRHPSPGSLEWSANFFFSNLPPTLLPE